MDIDPTVTRRTLLAAGAGGVGVAALAACSSSGTTSSTTDTQPPATQASTSEAPASSAPAPTSAAPASSSSEDSGGSGSGGKDALITLDDIKVGAAASVKLANGKPGIVTRLSSSTAVCFSAICTHMGCTVAPTTSELDCPCHGSKFNMKTGAVLNGPASSPLNKVPVTVQSGKVVET